MSDGSRVTSFGADLEDLFKEFRDALMSSPASVLIDVRGKKSLETF